MNHTEALDFGARSVPLQFVRSLRSRRYILRVLPDGTARISVPRGGSIPSAKEFATKHRAWIERQLQRCPPSWAHGVSIFFRGELVPLKVQEDSTGRSIQFGGVQLPHSSDRSIRDTVQAFLRSIAEAELPLRTCELASLHDAAPARVTIRDQRSRWGSCSSKGHISLNWRLIQTPHFVRDYIIIHELMHLREMNHSDRFWERVQKACPSYIDAERWLRKNAALLR